MKSPYQKRVLPFFMALALGGSLPVISQATQGNAGSSTVETIIVQPARKLDARESDLISREATRVLVQIADARAALAKKDRSRAEKALGSARALLELIKRERPTEKVIDRVEVAKKHLEYEETATIAADLVPIYSDLTLIEDLVPVHEAKAQLRKAKKALDQGDREAARQALIALEDSLVYTEIDLPVSSTERHVEAAQKALSAGDMKNADKALREAEAGMVYLSTVVVTPLAQARDDLYLARLDYNAKRYDQAKKDLIAANRWLDMANRDMQTGTPDAVQRFELINDMKRQIDELAVSMDRLKKEQGVGKRLEGLWHKLSAMVETEVETAFVRHGKASPGPDVRPGLIRAKQHVAFAENLQFYADSDPQDIFKALDDARRELEAVSKNLPGNKVVEKALQQIAGLRKNPDQRDLYESVRVELRKLIHERS